jgi:hypothetical protein
VSKQDRQVWCLNIKYLHVQDANKRNTSNALFIAFEHVFLLRAGTVAKRDRRLGGGHDPLEYKEEHIQEKL